MAESLVQLIVLFFVIIDPLASFAVFFSATEHLLESEKRRIALLAVGVATVIAVAFLIGGQGLLKLLNTDIPHFRIAGGIILTILGIEMSLGISLNHAESVHGDSARGIAAIIATPLITGPATITAIMISTSDNGPFITALALLIVLFVTGLVFYFSDWLTRWLSKTAIQVITTMLGLITLAWGLNFIFIGLQAIGVIAVP